MKHRLPNYACRTAPLGVPSRLRRLPGALWLAVMLAFGVAALADGYRTTPPRDLGAIFRRAYADLREANVADDRRNRALSQQWEQQAALFRQKNQPAQQRDVQAVAQLYAELAACNRQIVEAIDRAAFDDASRQAMERLRLLEARLREYKLTPERSWYTFQEVAELHRTKVKYHLRQLGVLPFLKTHWELPKPAPKGSP